VCPDFAFSRATEAEDAEDEAAVEAQGADFGPERNLSGKKETDDHWEKTDNDENDDDVRENVALEKEN